MNNDSVYNTEMISALYRAFLGREPEPQAFAHYMAALAEGSLDAKSLIKLFLNCDEYRHRQAGGRDLWVPAGHYYSPIVNVEELRADAARIFNRSRWPAGVDLNEASQLALVPVLRSLARDLPFQETKNDGLLYYFNNPSYGHGDAVVLACMIRHLRPRRILEFGCGFSSCVILDVNRIFFGGVIDCTFVDPYPQLLRDLLAGYTGHARIIESRAQDIDRDIVHSLQKNDILFIDSTHVSKAGSDVNFHFFETLPALQTGVFIHVHDVSYPFEYPEAWFFDENRSWNELYLLRAFLMYNSVYSIEFFNHFLSCVHPDVVNTIPWFARNGGGAIWLRKCGTKDIDEGAG